MRSSSRNRRTKYIEQDERSRKEILREMACDDPDERPAAIVYRYVYERDYGETPWEDDDA